MTMARITKLGLLCCVLAWAAPVAADGVTNGLSVAVSRDGAQLVAGGDVRALYELDPETLKVKRRVYLGRRVQEMAFSKDGSVLVVESTKALQWLDAKTLRPTKTEEKMGRMSVASEADLLAVNSTDRTRVIKVLRMTTGEQTAEIPYDRRQSIAAFGISPDGKRLALMYYRRKDESEAVVGYKDIPKDLKDAAKREFQQKHDGYMAQLLVFDVATGKTTLDKKLWYSPKGGGNRVVFAGDAIHVIAYDNQNARVTMAGEVTYFELGNSYNYGVGAAPDGSVVFSGGLRDGNRTVLDGFEATPFRLSEVMGFPEYFKDFDVSADGTGYGGTTAWRIIKISPDGKIAKSKPVY